MIRPDSFIGRDESLAVLREALARAREGEGGIFLARGPAGIGKSRLLAEFARSEAAANVGIREGRCFQGLGTPPFWPWLQIIRQGLDYDPGILDRLGPSAAVIREVLEAPPPPRIPAFVDPTADPTAARFRLFEAAATLLRSASQDIPQLILIEDLHWADHPSLYLLRFLADTIARSRVLVIGTHREGDGDTETRSLLADLGRVRNATPLRLPPLSPAATASLAVALGSGLPTPILERITSESDGNPLFVTELVRDALERVACAGASPPAPAALVQIPDQLRRVIGQRLARLSEETLDILRCAAVIGNEFEFGLLTASMRLADASVEPAVIDAALSEAEAAGIVAREARGDHFRFSHSLLREAIYEDLRSRRRVNLHECVGRALATRARISGDEPLNELAHHFYEAALGGSVVEALHYSERAGERARAVAAYEDARRHFGRALQVQELLTEPSASDRCRLLVGLAEAEVLAGNVGEANHVARRGMALAREIGDAALFARAVVTYRGIWGVVGKTDYEHIKLLEEALRRLGEEDSALRVVVMGRLATELYWTADHDHRAAIGRSMLAMARRVGDPHTLVRALNAGHWALWQPDNPLERLAIARENVEAAERNGDSLVLVGGLVWMVIDLAELGRVAEARTYVARHAEAAERLGTPHVRWQSAVMRAFVAMIDGRLDEAETLAGDALRLGADALGTNAEVFFAVQMLQLAWHRGSLDQLVAAAESFSAQLPGLLAWRAALALIYAANQRADEARREIEALARDQFAAIPHDTNYVISHAFLAEACALIGERRFTATLHARLLPHRAHLAVVGNAAACFGAVSYFLGRLAALNEDKTTALTFYREALDLYAKQRMPALARHAQIALAEIDGTASPIKAEGPASPAVSSIVFRRTGGFWEVGAAGATLRVRDGKGMDYLHVLLANPGVEVAAVDLVGAISTQATPGASILSVRADLGDAGELLDTRARAAYRD